jgi:hypothetical protein
MSDRKMTSKMFLNRSNGKVSATAFLAQHRVFLETGDLAEYTSPILRQIDAREILPTPGLQAIKAVVLSHHLAVESRKAETAMEKAATEPGTRKSYLATILDSEGNVCTRINDKGAEVDLRESFDMGSDAERWCDRRLFDGASDWFGMVEMTKIHNSDGEPLTTIIMRQDAIARILKIKKGPVSKSKPKSTGSLSFGVKVSNSVAKFSHG